MGHYNYKIKKHTRKIIIYCEQKFIVVQTGATATVSTLATVVGQPNTPTKERHCQCKFGSLFQNSAIQGITLQTAQCNLQKFLLLQHATIFPQKILLMIN